MWKDLLVVKGVYLIGMLDNKMLWNICFLLWLGYFLSLYYYFRCLYLEVIVLYEIVFIVYVNKFLVLLYMIKWWDVIYDIEKNYYVCDYFF